MKSRSTLAITLLFLFTAVILSACGSDPVTVNDLPVYPNAVALEPGDDPIADTLANNAQQDAALRANIGVGGSVNQKAYRLPEGTTWEQVKSFFNAELDSAGWESGLGGLAGDLTGDILESANAGNEFFQTAMWSKDKQNLTVFRMTDTTNPDQPYLILSLATN
jgi:hypothetical protein